jgi:integral membrane protein (TIGR01906 family)
VSGSATTAAAPRLGWRAALAVLLALAVPAVLVGNALLVTVQPWTIDAQYALPGFPDPAIALSGAEREHLAKDGVRSISPWNGDGVELLRRARLTGGAAAFDAREIAHMSDVRAVVRGFFAAWLAGLAVLLAGWLALRHEPALLRRALAWGAAATLALFAALGLLMLVGFDAFFTSFHGLFFDGDSWRFADDSTLLSLYPDAFWGVAGGVVAALVLLQAGLLLWRARAG